MILVVISLAISSFLAELLLRKEFPIENVTPFQFRIPHPVFGWVLEPGASYINQMPEAGVQVAYNSKGFRDVEHSFKNRHGAFRILVLGDSFMEAYSVELNDAFHKRIEQFLVKKGIDVEVINLGVGGYGTLQEYLVFHEVGQLYKPNLVLIGFYIGNDVSNNSIELESKINSSDPLKVASRPFLDLADSTGWRTTVVDYEGAQARYAAAKLRQNSFLGKLIGQSALLQTLKKALNRFVIRLEKSRESQNDQRERHLAVSGVYYCQEPPEYTKAWDITKQILARIKQDAQSIGSELLVFSVPGFHEVKVGAMEKLIKDAPNHAAPRLEEPPAYERLRTILKELDIEYVDLIPDFSNVMQNGDTNLFWRSDKHWNPEGHALAAKLVGSFLLEKNLLSSTGN